MQSEQVEQVVQKLLALTPDRIEQVGDFIDFLSRRDRGKQLTRAAMTVSESRLNTLWDNPDDSEYDKL